MPTMTPRQHLEHWRHQVAELEQDLLESEELLQAKRDELRRTTERVVACKEQLAQVADPRIP